MIKPDAPAFPQGFATSPEGAMYCSSEKHPDFGGLTIRAELSARFVAAVLAGPEDGTPVQFDYRHEKSGRTHRCPHSPPCEPGEDWQDWKRVTTYQQELAREAIKYADALIAELNS